MRPERVILLPPPFDNHLRLLKRIENLPVEHFISQFSIERFIVSILPGATGFDKKRFDSNPFKPVSDCLGRKFRPVVGADVRRAPMGDKKIRQAVKHIIGLDLPGHDRRQRLPAVLVDDGQNLDCPSVVCSIRHEIIGPHMITMHRPETDTGAVIEP